MPPPSRIYHHITNDSPPWWIVWSGHFKQTPESAQDLIALGAIYHNKLRVLENLMLEKGAYLRLHLKPKRYAVDHIDWKTRVVAQTPDYVVIDKPAGVPTYATVDNLIENALAQTRIATGKELLATQRLDVPVSGLLVFAVNKNFQTYFNKLLMNAE